MLNFSYLSNCIRRSKIEEYLSNWLKTEYAVPQCPILGYLHLNINSVDILYECEDPDIENYAGDTTPHTCVSDINTVISELLLAVDKLFSWCNNNHMKANPEKRHLLLSSKTPKKTYFGGALVESSSTGKLFVIQIDSELNFDKHISSICNKVGKKNICTQQSCLLCHLISAVW